MIENKKALEYGQSNHLIEAIYHMDLDCKRLLLLGLSRIKYRSNNTSKWAFTFTLKVNDWREVYGNDGPNDYKRMKSAAIRLMKGDSSCVYIPHRGWDSELVHWFSTCKYKDGSGCVEMVFDETMREYLCNLQNEFTPIDLRAIAKLRSVYSIRIYELCRQYRSIGHREISVPDLRSMLGLTEKYPKFTDFRRYVLAQAHKEINKVTPMQMDWESKKHGRSVTSIRFFDINEDPPSPSMASISAM